MRPINGLEDAVLVKNRQGSGKAGVELGRQGDEMDHGGRSQRQQAGRKGKEAQSRSAGEDAEERRDNEYTSTDLLDSPRGLDQSRAQPQRRIALVIL